MSDRRTSECKGLAVVRSEVEKIYDEIDKVHIGISKNRMYDKVILFTGLVALTLKIVDMYYG